MDTPTKTCRMCAETIKAAAKVCPYCQARQARFPFLKNDLILLSSLVIFSGAAVVFSRFDFDRNQKQVRDFNKYRDDLKVTRTSLQPVTTLHPVTHPVTNMITGMPMFQYWVTGYVTNRGAYPWKVHEFEARFLDASNRLIEAKQTSPENHLSVLPHQEYAFRLKIYTDALTTTNAVVQARVLKAYQLE